MGCDFAVIDVPGVIVSATAVSSVTGCGESFLIFHVSAIGAMIVPSALTRHGTDVGTLIFYVVVRGGLRGGLCCLCVIGVRLRGALVSLSP